MDVCSILHPYFSVTSNWQLSKVLRRPSIQRIFDIQALDHGCYLIPLSYSVSFTVIASPRAISSHCHYCYPTLSHSRLSLLPAPSRHLVTIAIRLVTLVQPSIYLRSFILLSYGFSSAYPHMYQVLHSRRLATFVKNPCCHLLISVIQVILSLSSCRCRSSQLRRLKHKIWSELPHRKMKYQEMYCSSYLGITPLWLC
jgi:hypothetical protein